LAHVCHVKLAIVGFFVFVSMYLPSRISVSASQHLAVVIILTAVFTLQYGSILQALQDPTGAVFHGVTSAVEHEGKLYLGSLTDPGVPVIDLRAAGLLK
jgi:hypothetical protein